VENPKIPKIVIFAIFGIMAKTIGKYEKIISVLVKV
jgi:hypothetical protein